MPDLLKRIDHFYPEPDLIREIALRSKYYQPRGLYGFRSTQGFLARGTIEKIQAVFGFTEIMLQNVRTRSTHFYNSLIRGQQRVHFLAHVDDKYDAERPAFALVIYLAPNAPPESGTSIYRHRSTGIWQDPTRADAERLGTTLKELRHRLNVTEAGDPKHWELLDSVENVYNRAVLIPAHWYHSSSREFGSRTDNGKLFHAFFFKARLAANGERRSGFRA